MADPAVVPAAEAFPIGSRVRVSEEGFDNWVFGDKYRYRIGTVRGRSRNPRCVSVTWDGIKNSQSVHASYLELFKEPAP